MTENATTVTSLDFSDVYIKWNGCYDLSALTAGYVLEYDAVDTLSEASINPEDFTGWSSYYLIVESGTYFDLFEDATFHKIVVMDADGRINTITLPDNAATQDIRVNRSRQTYGKGPRN